ncbi:Heparanase-like protein 3, partial [Glycine soja]
CIKGNITSMREHAELLSSIKDDITDFKVASEGTNQARSSLVRYLDQLGIASCYSTKVYCRQTLIGGNYGLLNTTTFAPNPDYYSRYRVPQATYIHRNGSLTCLNEFSEIYDLCSSHACCSIFSCTHKNAGVSCKQWCPGTCQQYPKGKCEAFCKANGYQIGKCVPPENAFCCCAKIGDQIFN